MAEFDRVRQPYTTEDDQRVGDEERALASVVELDAARKWPDALRRELGVLTGTAELVLDDELEDPRYGVYPRRSA